MLNFKVRFKNPVFVTTFMTTIVAFIYTMLGMFGIMPAISENVMIQAIAILVEVLSAFGVLVDPTTKGMRDSENALTYTEPQ